MYDASQNYPAWLSALGAARRHVRFENYIFSDDVTGGTFAAALDDAARRGVRVEVLLDWVGCLGERVRPLVRRLAAAGAEVRLFNPPRLDRPLALLTRDHRKALAVDGEVAFVSGLCISDRWAGIGARRTEEWRDTGVELRGPAVAQVEGAFDLAWAVAGGAPVRPEPVPTPAGPPRGDVAVRVLATEPSEAGVFRLDLLVCALARRALFLADAYFFATAPYVEALRAAARDGVDVRLLVPGESDLWLASSLARAGYRPLLEAGVRVFEWNGPMMHAKTAVADGRWARVGSSNLNLSSWLGNYELDVTIEDEGVAAEMERRYLADLANATEVVLRRGRRARSAVVPAAAVPERRVAASAGRATAGAIRIGHTVGAALTGQRTLGRAEARVAGGGGAVLAAGCVAALIWPRLVVVPLAALGLWLAASLLLRAWTLARRPDGEVAAPAGTTAGERPATPPAAAGAPPEPPRSGA